MKIFHLLKKHYFATSLFIIGLIITAYSGYSLYQKPIQTEIKKIEQTQTETTQTLEDAQNPNLKKIKNPVQKTNSTSTAIIALTDSSPSTSTKQNPNSPAALSSGTIIILGKTYPVQFTENSSVYQVLKHMNDDEKATITFKNYSGLGYFVDGIDGVNADTLRAKYWIYYINGTKAQIGISNYFLKQNDVITWKYEKAE